MFCCCEIHLLFHIILHIGFVLETSIPIRLYSTALISNVELFTVKCSINTVTSLYNLHNEDTHDACTLQPCVSDHCEKGSVYINERMFTNTESTEP